MPKKSKSTKPGALYRSPPPPLPDESGLRADAIVTTAFVLREDGGIQVNGHAPPASNAAPPPQLIYRDDARGLWLYHGNCLELLDAIAAKYPEGRFYMVFADPPYFLSNGGITCHAGKMVRVDKGEWAQLSGHNPHSINCLGEPISEDTPICCVNSCGRSSC